MTPAGAGGAVVETRGLVKRYGPLAALDGVDLRLEAGETVALLGANGAGKSTLLRLLATLTRPSAGTLRLFGRPVESATAGLLRRRLGFLSHHTFLYDHLTGRENLLFYARLYGLPDPAEAARAALLQARLAERQDDRVATYSRGMQQRLALARVFLHAPEILLLDEPTTGLDRESAARLEERLRSERGAGRACLLATHDAPLAGRLATRVVALRSGRVVLDAAASEVDPERLDATLAPADRASAAGRA